MYYTNCILAYEMLIINKFIPVALSFANIFILDFFKLLKFLLEVIEQSEISI